MNGILTNGNLDRDENLAEVYDSEKNNQLKNSEKGKGHWKQSLASNSEASVCCSPFLLRIIYVGWRISVLTSIVAGIGQGRP